jgi:hypothetical protein
MMQGVGWQVYGFITFFNSLVCGRLWVVTLVFISSLAFAGTMDVNLGGFCDCLSLYLIVLWDDNLTGSVGPTTNEILYS